MSKTTKTMTPAANDTGLPVAIYARYSTDRMRGPSMIRCAAVEYTLSTAATAS